MSLSQNDAPLYEALLEYKENRIVSFDVPGHKQGKGNSELTNFLGMHFSMLRTTDGERSIIGLVVSPLYLASRMPRSLAMVCRLQ